MCGCYYEYLDVYMRMLCLEVQNVQMCKICKITLTLKITLLVSLENVQNVWMFMCGYL